MIAPGAAGLAWRTLQTALFLYGRHFVLLTAVSLLPALLRFAYFLGTFSAGAPANMVEAIVGVSRIVLFYICLRLVWPHRTVSEFAREGADSRFQLSQISWPGVLWQAVMIGAVVLVLNLAAYGIGEATTLAVPHMKPAVTFALKNSFVIPFFLVHLMVAIRALFWES